VAHSSPILRPACKLASISHAIALLVLGASAAQAQQPTLGTVTINERRSAPVADVTGFGDLPLRELPLSATVIGQRQMQDAGARRLADLTAFDPSVNDAYNAPGYWDFLSVRGFTLDNRFNYRREGLPISAETIIPLDNKERIEILKGTSGIQAGTSAPGGLVNYVVKRPTQQPLREVRAEVSERGSVLGALDLSSRFGTGNAFGIRLNAAQERLRPQVRSTDGERSVLAVATDWRLTKDTVLEGELEWSRREQASQVGFSLLGNVLPAPVDPRLNLNNQPWLPKSQFEGLTGTVRLQQALGANWSWSAQLGSQRLKTDDRTAFPFGCTASNGIDYYADRFCPDGTFDLYDFRSDNERRRQQAAAVALKGKLQTGAVSHDLSFGLLRSQVRNRFDRQAFNPVGTGNISGNVVLAADPRLTDENTNRDERSTELSIQDGIRWNDRFTSWVGVRHTQLHRESVRTDGSRPTSYGQSINTPWLALSYKLASSAMVYGSWGQGAESEVVPNRTATYTNAGQALPVRKSRQVELGIKGGSGGTSWNAAVFRIEQPAFTDDCAASPCTRRADGEAVHTGLELDSSQRWGALTVGVGVMVLDAERQGGTVNPALNGRRPINVPDWTLKARAQWAMTQVPGLSLGARLVHEGKRSVVADESIMLPAWTRVDATLGYETKLGATATRWSAGVDNVFNRKYWRESPLQFGHVYLYTGAPRTFRVAFTAAL
jgi:iron complex outermembrane receptor protein